MWFSASVYFISSTVDLSEYLHTLTSALIFSGSCEVTKSGLTSGLLVDWLEHLDPEVTSVCPDLQQKLLFALNKVRSCFFSCRLYLVC